MNDSVREAEVATDIYPLTVEEYETLDVIAENVEVE